MRIKRQKKVNRILKFYTNNFGFRKPYQLLVDGTFCNTALENKININEQLSKYLGGDIKLVTTPCAILEIEKLGPALYGAMLILKQFPIHQCGHKNPVFAASCLKSMIGKNNEPRYILATQDRDLQRHARYLPGVPVMYIFNKAPTLDIPNMLSQQKAAKQQQSLTLSSTEEKVIKEMKKELLGPDTFPRPFRKRKKKGGPNPLSCKKKQKPNSDKKKKQH